ncbi:ABC transporter ATP-binding protein [Parafrigoribacterium mesophilum]|uniref:ABC transporter ATP-binding protein n=1 Tax=Parafrigoribacterium mesophilum TaxID=433646 RepID=UPI0031FCC4B5
MADEGMTLADGSAEQLPALGSSHPRRGKRQKPTTSGSSALSIRGLHAYYGTAHVLHGVDFEADAGSAVAVLGRNGAGKSTMLKSIAGTGDVARTGVVQIGDTELQGMRADQVARCGVQLVPEDRRVFAGLSVRENLELAARGAHVARGVDYVGRILSVFPEIEAFLGSGGGELSGGQQQMVAVARALVGEPRLLLLDEPSTGLAPVVVDRLLESLQKLRSFGATMLVAEQNVNFALEVCDEVVILEKGMPVFRGTKAEVNNNPDLKKSYLEV